MFSTQIIELGNKAGGMFAGRPVESQASHNAPVADISLRLGL